MKIAVFSIPQISTGKRNIKDSRLDEVDAIQKAKKKTYIQIELVAEDVALDADAILALQETRADLVLKDLEFVETRLTRTTEESEKSLLTTLKAALEKEEFIFTVTLSDAQKEITRGYGLLTNKPIVLAARGDLEDENALLARAVKEAGFISFFTSGDKEVRAWLIRLGTIAWEAAGSVHSDIQRGFIRAEIIHLDDFLKLGGETAAKQAGKLSLEQKEYVMQDADIVNFRFSK